MGHKPKTVVAYTTIGSIFNLWIKNSEDQEKENKETPRFPDN